MPFPPLDGGAQVMHYTTQGLLANKIDVKVLAINPTRNFIDLKRLPDEYIKSTRFEFVKVDTTINPIRFLVNFFKRESYFIERFVSKAFEEKLIAILTNEKFDIIQLEHLYLCKYIDVLRLFSNAKIIFRPQNVEYIVWERYLVGVKNPIKFFLLKVATKRLKKYEIGITNNLDGIFALTKEDAKEFNTFSKCPVYIIPMGYDYENIKEYDYEKQYAKSLVVYHLASMDWLPNEEGVKWFLEKVLPLIEKENKEVAIVIAGKKMPDWVYQYKSKNTKILGEIFNPLEFQSDKSIMIVPLWSGSGIRAKIIEGMALGKTIIATTIGAQGIEYENEKNILIADTPSEFAKQIIRCVASPSLCKEIGESARALSLKRYHYKNTTKQMIHVYDKLLEKHE